MRTVYVHEPNSPSYLHEFKQNIRHDLRFFLDLIENFDDYIKTEIKQAGHEVKVICETAILKEIRILEITFYEEQFEFLDIKQETQEVLYYITDMEKAYQDLDKVLKSYKMLCRKLDLEVL